MIISHGDRTEWSTIQGVIARVIGRLRKQDGWNAQDGRMTKKRRVRLGRHSLAPHFFRHSAVPSFPAVLCYVRVLFKVRGDRACLLAHFFLQPSLHSGSCQISRQSLRYTFILKHGGCASFVFWSFSSLKMMKYADEFKILPLGVRLNLKWSC